MKDLLIKYENGEPSTNCTDSFTVTHKQTTVSCINKELYKSFTSPEPQNIELFLQILLRLIVSYRDSNIDGLRCNASHLQAQYDDLWTHVQLLSEDKVPFKCKLTLKQIKRVLFDV